MSRNRKRDARNARVAPTLEALYQQHGTLTARTVDLRVAVDMLPPTFERMSAEAERSMNVARGLTEDGLIPMLETVRQFPATMGPSVKSVEVLASPSLWSKIGDTAKSTVGGINDIFTAAFEGGGGVAEREMLRTFNCGVGMIVVAARAKAGEVEADLTATRSGMRLARRRLAVALGTPADTAFTRMFFVPRSQAR